MNIKKTLANVNKTQATKKVVRLATTVSVGVAVKNIIRSHVPEHDNPVVNFAVAAACLVGGAVAADYVLAQLGDYTDKQIDAIVRDLAPLLNKSNESEDAIEGTVQ